MSKSLEEHCDVIDGCNQRGGRMLSVVDLLDAGTLEPETAAYLLSAIGQGASFMIGALPGGAGKTTVMGALLNFVPADVALMVADTADTMDGAKTNGIKAACYVCHEIGPGGYHAYLWADLLQKYFELPAAGHMLATNLHADTYEQAFSQVCDENGVPADRFRKMHLLVFLELRRMRAGVLRRISTIWESDGKSSHRQILAAGAKLDSRSSMLADAKSLERSTVIIDKLMRSESRTIEQVRSFLVEERLKALS